jgi:hypothetical protein
LILPPQAQFMLEHLWGCLRPQTEESLGPT